MRTISRLAAEGPPERPRQLLSPLD